MELSELVGTKWSGKAELWLDPLGNEVIESDCTIAVHAEGVRYTWRHEDKDHEGSLTIVDGGAEFTDSWHQSQPMTCAAVADSWALLDVRGTYAAGSGPDWGWRTKLCFREPTGELVLQMTNVCPWGETGRAVRMTCKKQ